MRTDSFINRFFREFPGAFFRLIGEDEQNAARYEFISVEVKEQAFRFDGVFKPNSREDHRIFSGRSLKRNLIFICASSVRWRSISGRTSRKILGAR